MSGNGAYLPRTRPSKRILIAPFVLVSAFSIFSLADPEDIPAPALVLASNCYLAVIWWRNFRPLLRNSFDQSQSHRVLVGCAIIIFAVGWTTLLFVVADKVFCQRLFTIGPLGLGLMWLAFRRVEEVVTSRAIWRWWCIQSEHLIILAATFTGLGFLIRAVLNEVFIAIGNDTLWVISLATIPTVIVWLTNTMIVKFLIQRDGGFQANRQ